MLWSEKEFHDAAKRNDTGKMQELIKKGVDVKAKNKVSVWRENVHTSLNFVQFPITVDFRGMSVIALLMNSLSEWAWCLAHGYPALL